MQNKNREFLLISKKEEAENITSLFFKPADELDFNFIAGQYVSVSILSIGGRSKCYTISSVPSDKLICLTVKRQGEFSSELIDSKIGDKLIFNGPYGNFYPEENCGDLVFIAGGIGIAPFISVIRDRLNSPVCAGMKERSKITLLYSNKTMASVAFWDELSQLKESGAIDMVYFLTQEKNNKDPLIQEYSRINRELLKKYIFPFEKRNYYLCGSIQFVNAIWKELKGIGVPEENIFTESFY